MVSLCHHTRALDLHEACSSNPMPYSTLTQQ
uniref:Uncharacterized protein n=1 Tax=Anguilla anguilla TaxID=7936 RepID=A0A0E9TSA6_ANGAN